MAKIFNNNGVIEIIDDNGNKMNLASSPFSPPVEMALAEVDATFRNSWQRFGDWKTTVSKTNGVVTIQGLVSGGSTRTATVLILPPDYRPKAKFITTQRTSRGTQRLDFHEDGRIDILSGGSRNSVGEWVTIGASFEAQVP